MVAVSQAKPICTSDGLCNGGPGVRFQVEYQGEVLPAFVIRYQDQAHAYLNQCAHQAMELDWNEGQFFDRGGELLICATHGARYSPASGECAGGRCHGVGLTKLALVENQSGICLLEQDRVHLIEAQYGAQDIDGDTL